MKTSFLPLIYDISMLKIQKHAEKLIKHGRKVHSHVKKHHKKYIAGTLSSRLLVHLLLVKIALVKLAIFKVAIFSLASFGVLESTQLNAFAQEDTICI
jgi:hypothetical protein